MLGRFHKNQGAGTNEPGETTERGAETAHLEASRFGRPCYDPPRGKGRSEGEFMY